MAVPISLVLADDHPIVLEGLRTLLKEPEFHIAAVCRNGEQALEAIASIHPDVAVLDLQMPEMGGLDVLRHVRDRRLTIRCVVLTAGMDDVDVLEAVRLGAMGVVYKDAAARDLIQCIKTVATGRRFLDAELVTKLLDDQDYPYTRENLTSREIEIIRSIVSGKRNKEIAEQFGLTEGTVKSHLHNIYSKLGLSSRTELAVFAKDQNIKPN